MSEDERLLSWAFLLAEGFTWVGALEFSLSRIQLRISSDRLFPALRQSLAELPSVDVLIVRRGESIAATYQTARLAAQLDYPWHRLFVRIVDCDRDISLKRAAQAVPCKYCALNESRPRALEAILQQELLLGDYLLILEPGQLVESQLLQRVLPYFYDTHATAPIANRTGYVQPVLKQVGKHSLTHPLQRLVPFGEQGGDCAPLLGAGALFRRRALAELPQINWDHPVRLGVELHIRGWESYLCRTTTITGISIPYCGRLMSLVALQHALRLLPWWRIAVTQTQSCQYLWLALWSTSGFAAVLYFFVPIWYLWTERAPVPAFNLVFLAWFLPYAIAGRLTWLVSISPSSWRSTWLAERQSGAQFFQSIQATVLALRSPLATAKQPSWCSFIPQGIAILLTLSAILVGVVRLFNSSSRASIVAIAFSLAWATYNLVLLSVVPLKLLPPDPESVRSGMSNKKPPSA